MKSQAECLFLDARYHTRRPNDTYIEQRTISRATTGYASAIFEPKGIIGLLVPPVDSARIDEEERSDRPGAAAASSSSIM